MQNLNELITELANHLKKMNMTLVTAESCTGGGLAYAISTNKSCSSLLERGYVTYSNQSKEELLQVKKESLQLHGAVSKEVALEMAQGALKNSGAQISIATTGIAGVDKDSDKKHGQVWIGISYLTSQHIVFKKISGPRRIFMQKTIYFAVQELIEFLTKLKI